MAALINAAIKSLDNLNDQIVQFIYTPTRRHTEHERKSTECQLSPKDHETLKSSMSLMRHLLVDAQCKFRKMVEDNKRLAERIDGSIHAANQEVKAIRDELADTNRRLSQIGGGNSDVGSMKDSGAEEEPGIADTSNKSLDNQERDELYTLRDENTKLHDLLVQLKVELQRLRDTKSHPPYVNVEIGKEGDSVVNEQQVASPSNEADSISSSQQGATSSETSHQRSTIHNEQLRELQQKMVMAHQELTRAKEALLAMKADRKRLQSEKLDLLSQLRQLYCTLEDKESEIRDFIRNFEQQMRESNDSIKQMMLEKEDSEQEKWDILRRAQDASDRCLLLQTDLDQKNTLIEELQRHLFDTQERLKNYDNTFQSSTCDLSQPLHSSSRSSNLKSSSVSVDSMLKSSSIDGHSPSSEDLPPYQEVASVAGTVDTTPSNKSLKSDSSQFSYSNKNLSHSLDHMPPAAESTRSSEDMSDNVYVSIPTEYKTVIDLKQLPKKRRNTGALTKLFGKSRQRRSIAVSDPMLIEAGKSSRECSPVRAPKRSLTVHFVGIDDKDGNSDTTPNHSEQFSPRLSMLTEDNYQSKLDAMRQAKDLGIAKWKAGHVLSWVEIEMNMPMYGKACTENIKSGKVLLGLSDSELDSALNLESALHRRKLRLAIEELRDPTTIQYHKAAQLDHTWVAHRFLPDLGLPQYSSNFETQLIDGRLLNVLTKKDLEKYLGVQKKFHQTSVLYGVELLRRLKYDKEELNSRRTKCENSDCDPLVWTNHRLLQWLHSIDLQEYAISLNESGIHGALLVLESSFNVDAFATALSIPSNKSYVRRHLASELDNIVRPARSALEGPQKRPQSASSALNRSFVRSYRGGPTPSPDLQNANKGSSKRLSFRGSLGRALGRKPQKDTKKNGDMSSVDDLAIDSRKRCHSMEIQATAV